MKNFAQYLAESKKTFDYRIKIVGDVSADFVRDFKDKLKKFDPEKISDMKTTPVMAKPEGFPNYTNERVNIMDCSFRYPANLQQMQQVVELLGLDVNRLCMADLKWSEGMDREILGIEEQNEDLLNTPYPANSKEQNDLKKDYAAVGADKQVVKNSAADATWTVAGGRTPPAETTNDLPMGVKSPMTSIKRPPKPATGFRK